jgi:hypothetical protein
MARKSERKLPGVNASDAEGIVVPANSKLRDDVVPSSHLLAPAGRMNDHTMFGTPTVLAGQPTREGRCG